MVYFNPETLGFIPAQFRDDGTYPEERWPAAAVLLDGEEQAKYWKQPPPESKRLGSVDGRPAWVDLPPLLPLSREEIEVLRLQAYAEPLTGSDRYFSEAQRMQAMGENGWEAIRDAGISRFEEIQQLYPWP